MMRKNDSSGIRFFFQRLFITLLALLAGVTLKAQETEHNMAAQQVVGFVVSGGALVVDAPTAAKPARRAQKQPRLHKKTVHAKVAAKKPKKKLAEELAVVAPHQPDTSFVISLPQADPSIFISSLDSAKVSFSSTVYKLKLAIILGVLLGFRYGFLFVPIQFAGAAIYRRYFYRYYSGVSPPVAA